MQPRPPQLKFNIHHDQKFDNPKILPEADGRIAMKKLEAYLAENEEKQEGIDFMLTSSVLDGSVALA